MATIQLRDFCCQGGDKALDINNFTSSDLDIVTEGGRTLVFSPLGNEPRAPKLAVVGITPGGQITTFEQSLRCSRDVRKAAKDAAFAGANDVIRTLLNAHGFLDALGIHCPSNLNDSDEIFTTSLVKCCIRSAGAYLYKAPDILASKTAKYCVLHRFVGDVERYRTIRHIVIFGAPGWEAISTLRFQNVTLKAYFERQGLRVLNMPHFAQNYQQRAIYTLHRTEDEAYFAAKPKHKGYFFEADRMRESTIREVERLNRAKS